MEGPLFAFCLYVYLLTFLVLVGERERERSIRQLYDRARVLRNCLKFSCPQQSRRDISIYPSIYPSIFQSAYLSILTHLCWDGGKQEIGFSCNVQHICDMGKNMLCILMCLIKWSSARIYRDTTEALLLSNRMAACGYFFPIDDHVLAVKNDNTYYRFQVRRMERMKQLFYWYYTVQSLGVKWKLLYYDMLCL